MAPPVELCTRPASPPLWRRRATAFLIFLSTAAAPVSGFASDPGIEFFENKVRPILVDHCYPCHSVAAEKAKGGLHLDSRAGVLEGGGSGPAIAPGNPEKSLLISAVRYQDEALQMPPKGQKLSQEQIAALVEWVRIGAPDPREGAAQTTPKGSHGERTNHWAFRPVSRPPVPAVAHKGWVREPVDAFVLARQEALGLTPSGEADKRTLIRRVTFDLTGLPPTPAAVREFVGDDSPDAYARLVERLLASPEYGERWARHWLDVARYADTKGYVFEEERRYPYAYTYRDYVIKAFNDDLPFDRFITEQIAADQLPSGNDKRPLAALGYLTLGRRFLNNPHDIIDDRIDVVSRGMMALTVACARCHDHKFDPITAKDYYSLYGVFASCSEPEEKPLLGASAEPAGYPEYLQERRKRLDELHQFQSAKEAQVQSEVRCRVGDYLLAAHDADELPGPGGSEALARQRKLDPPTVERWRKALRAWRSEAFHPVFAPWFAVASLSEDEFTIRGAEVWLRALDENGERLNPILREALRETDPSDLGEAADAYERLFQDIEACWQETVDKARLPSAPAPSAFPDTDFEQLREVLYASNSPALVPSSELARLFDVPSIQKVRALKRKVEELDATHPGAPPRAMVLQDNPTPATAHVLLRGNPNNPGPEVPRRFLAFLAGDDAKPFQKGSGRLELAQAIASPDNPLTARVLVNRVWLHYFGVGLVRTPSDFGLRSEPPSHPELLDYLASRFMDEGWSLKKLHRWIVLSSTYRQSSHDQARNLQLDPANQWLWKMNRKRLDFEATRDSLLFASGSLDRTMGGHSVEITSASPAPRRTVYGFVERQNLPGLFRTFDFASPDATNPQRFATTVPQQALYLLNSSFVTRQAHSLAERTAGACSDDQRVRSLYWLALQREPLPREVDLGLRFIEKDQAQPSDPAGTAFSAWDRYAQVLLMSNEFAFVD